MDVYCRIDGKLTKWYVATACHVAAIETLQFSNAIARQQSPDLRIGPVLAVIEGIGGA